MSIRVACPSCRQKLRVPEDLADRRATCPRCHYPVRVPLPEAPPAEAPEHTPAPASAEAEEPVPASTRLGVVSLGLGLLSVLVLCLPVIGYVSLGLSGLGLMLGLWALWCSRQEGGPGISSPAARGAQGSSLVSSLLRNYPLAGTGACLLALALALLPFLFR